MDTTLAQIINELVRDTQLINAQAEQIQALQAENAALKSAHLGESCRAKRAPKTQEPA